MPDDNLDIQTINTAEYRITPGIYAREAVSHWTGRFWFLVALPIVALAAYGMWFDWRYIIVTACVVFILFPSFAFAGFNMALTSQGARYALYPQQVTLTDTDTLTVTFSPIPPRVLRNSRYSPVNGDDAEAVTTETETILPEVPAPAPLSFSADRIESCTRWKRHTVVECHGGLKLIIPDTAFRSGSESFIFEQRLLQLADKPSAR